MNTILYGAYGSNLNKVQMSYRCPDSRFAGVALLPGWKLSYKGSLSGNYLTIDKTGNKADIVPIGLWDVPPSDELKLDRYEGYPTFYQKVYVNIGGRAVMIYIMRPDASYGMPSRSYIDTCNRGYADCGLDEHRHILDEALVYTMEQIYGHDAVQAAFLR